MDAFITTPAQEFVDGEWVSTAGIPVNFAASLSDSAPITRALVAAFVEKPDASLWFLDV